MYSPFILFAFLSAIASQVLAFSLDLGDAGKIDVSQILVIPPSPVLTACNGNVTDTTSRITACNNDPTCLCRADTVASLLFSEQCMLSFLIQTNKPAPDFRAGSNPILGAYSTACNGSGIPLEANQTALVLPPNWNGPFTAVLPVAGAAVTVVAAGILGISALMILSNME